MTNSTQRHFIRSVAIYSYISGLPYFWFEELQWSPTLIHLRNYITRTISVINYILIVMIWFLPLCTQRNMNTEQIYSILMYNMLEPILYASTISLWYYKKEVTELMKELVVYAPTICCDAGVQTRMIKKAKTFILLFLSSMAFAMFMIGVQGAMRILKNELFITMITAWPDLEDRSQVAGVFRVIAYMAWWLLIFRLSGAIAIVLCLMTYTSHQFIQLQIYFCELAHIFEEDLSQLEKERKYEEALKIGFKFHSDIIRLTQKLVKTCNITYGGEIIANVVAIAVTMIRMANEEKTLTNMLTSAQIAFTVLIVTGFYVWNLGDITVEIGMYGGGPRHDGWPSRMRKPTSCVRRHERARLVHSTRSPRSVNS